MNKARFWIGHLYPSLQWGNKMSAPDSMCDSLRGKYRSRLIPGHLNIYGDIVFNRGSLITIHFPMQTCVTKGWWQVRKYWVLQRKRGMNRGNLVNGCWPGLIIAAPKSCVSATPQPLERFLFGNSYKLLILLLHGTQSGYLHAGAKPESSVKADIYRYSNWDFYSFSFSFTAARIPLQINYPRVIFFWRLCQRKSVFFFMCYLWADGYE